MTDGAAGPGVERPADFQSTVARWDAELKSAERATEQWRTDARRIANRYILEGRRVGGSGGDDFLRPSNREFNILHSNIQTLLPAVFGQEPVAVARRRHRDSDPVGRVAAEIMERALKTEMEGDRFYDTMRRVTQDLLLVARGVSWVRFKPTIVNEDNPSDPKNPLKRVVAVRTPIDYVVWLDFLHAPKNTWAEVAEAGWVARRVSMTRDEGIARFGEVFSQVPLSDDRDSDENDAAEIREVIGKANVWEIWDASTRTAIWLCRDYADSVLDERSDPLGLDEFFPCPCPAFGSLPNNKLVPTPDYLQYENLADQLDQQTYRIGVLVDAVRVTGVYDATLEGIGRMLEDDTVDKNQLIGIENFDALTGRTMEDVVKFLPLKDIVAAIIALYDARERTKQVLYEVSGLSDILRGNVDNKYEKLGQSRIKGQFASQRIQHKSRTIEECARDTIRIKAEIMVEHYDPSFLRQLSGFDFIPEIAELREKGEEGAAVAERLFDAAITLLKNEKMRGFRIDVETNSTVVTDDDSEKEGRVEFLRAAGEFLERALPIGLQVPALVPLVGDMLLFSVRGFRAGRQLESAFEEAVEALKAQAGAAAGQGDPAGDGERQKAQAEADKIQAQTQAATQKAQIDMARTRMKAEADLKKIEAEIVATEAELEATLAEVEAKKAALTEETEARRQAALIDVAKTQAQAAAKPPAASAA